MVIYFRTILANEIREMAILTVGVSLSPKKSREAGDYAGCVIPNAPQS